MYAKFLKRAFDFLLSLLALSVLSPILLLLCVIGAIAMGGNPFFVQPRPGKKEINGKEKNHNAQPLKQCHRFLKKINGNDTYKNDSATHGTYITENQRCSFHGFQGCYEFTCKAGSCYQGTDYGDSVNIIET